MDKIKKKLVAVNGDMKKCEDELTAINKDVDRAIGEKSRFHDYLWRVFRKKIKLEVDDDTDNEEEQEEEDDEEEENEGDDENGYSIIVLLNTYRRYNVENKVTILTL